MSEARFSPAGPLRGRLRPPPDKSISHRAALVGAMAEGKTRIRGYLDAGDTRATLAAIRELGAEVTGEPAPSESGSGAGELVVAGVGLRGPAEVGRIEVENAGTLMRLLPGWLAGQGRGRWTIDGDDSIRRRPVDRITEPLQAMGGKVSCRNGRLPPIRIEGAGLAGIEYELPVASAQVKSCVLLAGLLAEGETSVVEPLPTRDHSERMLRAAGAPIEVGDGRITIRATPALEAGEIRVPGDFSAAAFPLVAAVLVESSEVRLEGVGFNPTRTGLLAILERMGARVEVEESEPSRDSTAEPVATLIARHAELRGTRVDASDVPAAIDELPLVALLGCFAEGETVVSGAEELRHKESDRIATLVEGLAALGAEIAPRPDGFAVVGTGLLPGGRLDPGGDHRLAMLGAIAGLASRDGVTVAGMDATAISYPGFEGDLASLVS